VTSFQCDTCIFRTLLWREPVTTQSEDRFLMKWIRRVNLDALWSREPSTVNSLTRDVCKSIKLSQSMGISPPYPDLGPFLDHDDFGYGVALQMVWDSLEPGVYADCKQFDTLQRLRSTFSSVWEASAQGSLPVLAFASDDCKWVTSVTMCPMSSKWFKRFHGRIAKEDGSGLLAQPSHLY